MENNQLRALCSKLRTVGSGRKQPHRQGQARQIQSEKPWLRLPQRVENQALPASCRSTDTSIEKTDQGFEKISWDQATSEIAEKLGTIIQKYGPKSYAYIGGGGQGCHFEAAFGTALMKAIGSRYHYNAVAQELTGYFWACGRMLGRQNHFSIPDEQAADMLLAIGWNGVASHQAPRAPLMLKKFSREPDKKLVAIDPRKSETAQLANTHIALAPGTDALLAKSMIAIILREGWENTSYLEKHCTGFDSIRPWFANVDIDRSLEICEVPKDQIYELCKELSTRKWCMHTDLGVYMNRHSTLATYLYMVLAAVCGRFCVPGGNVIPGIIMPLGSHTDERDEKNWRCQTTDFPALMGYFPPNVLPEEILSDHPERTRAVLCSNANPLRSYADTTAYEKAFERLDLSVTIDVAMTETARMSDYVLPAKSPYEKYDGTFFPWNFPEVYFQLRQPVVESEGEQKEEGEIYTALAKKMGVITQLSAGHYAMR